MTYPDPKTAADEAWNRWGPAPISVWRRDEVRTAVEATCDAKIAAALATERAATAKAIEGAKAAVLDECARIMAAPVDPEHVRQTMLEAVPAPKPPCEICGGAEWMCNDGSCVTIGCWSGGHRGRRPCVCVAGKEPSEDPREVGYGDSVPMKRREPPPPAETTAPERTWLRQNGPSDSYGRWVRSIDCGAAEAGAVMFVRGDLLTAATERAEAAERRADESHTFCDCKCLAGTYYSAEADNYYCNKCKRGMGSEYHKAAKARDKAESEAATLRAELETASRELGDTTNRLAIAQGAAERALIERHEVRGALKAEAGERTQDAAARVAAERDAALARQEDLANDGRRLQDERNAALARAEKAERQIEDGRTAYAAALESEIQRAGKAESSAATRRAELEKLRSVVEAQAIEIAKLDVMAQRQIDGLQAEIAARGAERDAAVRRAEEAEQELEAEAVINFKHKLVYRAYHQANLVLQEIRSLTAARGDIEPAQAVKGAIKAAEQRGKVWGLRTAAIAARDHPLCTTTLRTHDYLVLEADRLESEGRKEGT